MTDNTQLFNVLIVTRLSFEVLVNGPLAEIESTPDVCFAEKLKVDST